MERSWGRPARCLRRIPLHQERLPLRIMIHDDIELIRSIHNLVKVRGFKLAAARKILTQNRKGVDKKADVLSSLINIRTELQTLRKQLDYLQ